MQSLLPIVVFGVVGLSVVMSIVFLLSGGSAYDEIGRGGLGGDREQGGGGGPPHPLAPSGGLAAGQSMPSASPHAQRAEREQEIRQMLGARSERRVRRGEPALDIEAELAALTASQPAVAQPDDGVSEEVRQLVIARNERRERQGLAPLDVQAEVRRTLAELGP